MAGGYIKRERRRNNTMSKLYGGKFVPTKRRDETVTRREQLLKDGLRGTSLYTCGIQQDRFHE